MGDTYLEYREARAGAVGVCEYGGDHVDRGAGQRDRGIKVGEDRHSGTRK